MSKAYQVGYPLAYSISTEKYSYSYSSGNYNVSLNRIVVANGKDVVGSWADFSCSFDFDNARPVNGIVSNFQRFLGGFFTSLTLSYEPIFSGSFLGPTYAGEDYIWYTAPQNTILKYYVGNPRPYSGRVSVSVLTHLGGDYYTVQYEMTVNGETFTGVDTNAYIPSTSTTVFCCGGNNSLENATANIYNISINDAWEFSLDPQPMENMCPVGKKNWKGPQFSNTAYSAISNCEVYSTSAVILNGGYYASPVIPQLGATHHVIQRYRISDVSTGANWVSDIGFFGASDTTMRSYIRISGSPTLGTITVWGDANQQDLMDEYRYPNKGAHVLNARDKEFYVSVKRVFDESVSSGYIYSTVTVELYDDSIVYAHFEYRSRESYTGQSIRFSCQVSDVDAVTEVATISEQFVATSGLPYNCIGYIFSDFTYSPVFGYPIRFTSTSLSVQGITSYLWNFGDGTTSTEENPMHVYRINGPTQVSLTVTGPDGSSTSTQTVFAVMGTNSWGYSSDYLIQQYKDGVSLPSFVNCQGSRMRAIADELFVMLPKLHSLQIAESNQLNNIGKTVDAGRGSLSDADYRLWIEFIQRVNAAGGEPEILIEYIKKFLSPVISTLMFDEGNASVNIQLMTDSIVADSTVISLVSELSRIVPASVLVRLFYNPEGDTFSVADEGAISTVGAGFSEEVTELPTFENRTTGGQFIDPYTV